MSTDSEEEEPQCVSFFDLVQGADSTPEERQVSPPKPFREYFDLSHISDDELKEKVFKLLESYESIFITEGKELGSTTALTFRVNLEPNTAPIKQAPYRIPWAQMDRIKEMIDDMERMKIIEPSCSAWAAPVVIAKRTLPSGVVKYRPCFDYRKLNEHLIPDVHPVPQIDEVLMTLGGSKVLSVLDLVLGYWQCKVHDDDKDILSICLPWGTYRVNRLPFGIATAPGAFQRMMQKVLRGIDHVKVYLDDILLFSPEPEHHLEVLSIVFAALKENSLMLRPDKVKLFQHTINYLGHELSSEGVRPNSDRVVAIQNYKTPTNSTEVASFLGMVGWVRKFIEHFTEKALPLLRLQKKSVLFQWGPEEEASFQALKQALVDAPVLRYPHPDKPYKLYCDASQYGIGAVLMQAFEDGDHPLAFFSKALSKAQVNYSVTEKEMYAVVAAVQKFRFLLWGRFFTVFTDHQALKALKSLKDSTNSRLCRWGLQLSEFSFEVVYLPGKLMPADGLSRQNSPPGPEQEGSAPVLHLTVEYDDSDWEPLWDRQHIAQEQLADGELRESISTLRGDPFALELFRLDAEGLLYRMSDEPSRFPDVLVAPKAMTTHILHVLHDAPFSAHPGVQRTFDRVRKYFWWKSLYKDAQDYVSKCVSCALFKRGKQGRRAPLQRFPPIDRPGKLASVDLVRAVRIVTLHFGFKR